MKESEKQKGMYETIERVCISYLTGGQIQRAAQKQSWPHGNIRRGVRLQEGVDVLPHGRQPFQDRGQARAAGRTTQFSNQLLPPEVSEKKKKI